MIIVIGGMGFIGLNTVIRLLEVGEDVVVTQHSASRVPDIIKEHVGKRLFIERWDPASLYPRNPPNSMASGRKIR